MRKPKQPITRRMHAAINNFYSLAGGKGEVAIPAKRVRVNVSTEPSEAQILKAVMKLLKAHPKVARVWRQNSGTFQVGERFVRANTAHGMSDIMGILKDGRTLAVEVKTRIGRVEQHQWDFLRSINDAGGLAFVARSVDDAVNALNQGA